MLILRITFKKTLRGVDFSPACGKNKQELLKYVTCSFNAHPSHHNGTAFNADSSQASSPIVFG